MERTLPWCNLQAMRWASMQRVATVMQRGVLDFVARHADECGISFPGRRAIAASLGNPTLRSVTRAIGQLVRLRLLERYQDSTGRWYFRIPYRRQAPPSDTVEPRSRRSRSSGRRRLFAGQASPGGETPESRGGGLQSPPINRSIEQYQRTGLGNTTPTDPATSGPTSGFAKSAPPESADSPAAAEPPPPPTSPPSSPPSPRPDPRQVRNAEKALADAMADIWNAAIVNFRSPVRRILMIGSRRRRLLVDTFNRPEIAQDMARWRCFSEWAACDKRLQGRFSTKGWRGDIEAAIGDEKTYDRVVEASGLIDPVPGVAAPQVASSSMSQTTTNRMPEWGEVPPDDQEPDEERMAFLMSLIAEDDRKAAAGEDSPTIL